MSTAEKEPRSRRAVAKSKPARSPSAEEELPALMLFGEFPGQVTVVPRSIATLLMCTGAVEEDQRRRHVLVPLVEMKFSGIRQGELDPELWPDQELEELFSRVLPLENALWLLADLTRDIRAACVRLRDLSAGAAVLERVRLAQTIEYADDLRQQAELTSVLLGELAAEPHRAITPERAAEAPAPEPSSGTVKRKRARLRTSAA